VGCRRGRPAGLSAPIPFSVAGTESAALADLSPATTAGGYVVLQSPVLTEDVRLFGSPVDPRGHGDRAAPGRPSRPPSSTSTRHPDDRRSRDDPAAAVAGDARPGPTRAYAVASSSCASATARACATPWSRADDYTFLKATASPCSCRPRSLEWVAPMPYDGSRVRDLRVVPARARAGTSVTLPVVGNVKPAACSPRQSARAPCALQSRVAPCRRRESAAA
jgi:hypothetical protein